MSKNQQQQPNELETTSTQNTIISTSIPKCRICLTNKSSVSHLLALNNLTLNASSSNEEAATCIGQNLIRNVSPASVQAQANNTTENVNNNSASTTNSSSNLANKTQINSNKSNKFKTVSNQSSDLVFNHLNSIITKNKTSLFNLNQHDLEQLTNFANSLNRHTCIIERLSGLFLNESLADVHFLVGKPNAISTSSSIAELYTFKSTDSNEISYLEKLPAHKLILSIGSQVFMAMFYGSGSHMHSNNSIIEIPDVEPESFKQTLRYLYTDELQIGPDTVMSTLYVAKKYAVNTLEKECVDFLKLNLRPDNAFMLLEQALLFDELHLADLCLNLIDKNSCEAFASEYFLDINLNTLILIIKRDTLGIREFKLFYYLIKWAQNKCAKTGLVPVSRENLRLVLGDSIKHIRFTLMSKEEFAVIMNDYDSRVLDDEAIVELFVNLTLMSNNNNDNNSGVGTNFENSFGYLKSNNIMLKKLDYNEKSRCCLGGKEQLINRFCHVESRWGYSGTSDRVRFSVNRRIYVVGFGLYGSIYGKCEYQAVIQLIHCDSCTTCAQNSTMFTSDGTNSTFKVMFKDPVEIQPDTDFIAAATLKGPDSYYGTKGLRKVCHENTSGGKVTFNFQYASGNNNGTSVEDGQIPEIIFLYSCS